MKKYFKIPSLLFIILLICNSCEVNNLNDEIQNAELELNSQVTLVKSTTYVSNLFLNMGVTGINVSSKTNSKIYEFKTEKEFWMNNQSIDLSKYKVILEHGKIHLESNPNFNLSLLDNQPYIISSNYSGFVESVDYFSNIDFNILMIFMNELITEDYLKIDAEALVNNNSSLLEKSCSFWNTYYVFSAAFSRSVSIANLQGEINNFTSGFNILDISDCTQFGGVDTSCVTQNHGCISTQAFCCN